MRILVIIHNQRGVGPYSKVFGMCLAMKDLGNSVTILCTSPVAKGRFSSSVDRDITVWESPDLLAGRLRQGIDIWNTMRRILRLRKERFDIVHAIDCRPVVILPALFMKYVGNSPLLLSWWDLFGSGGSANERSGRFYARSFGLIETLFEERFRKYADKATVVSSELRRRLLDLGFPQERIDLQRVGVTASDFQNVGKKKARKLLSLPVDADILCYAGTIFESDKQLLINALRTVRSMIAKMPLTILLGSHKIDSQVCQDLNIVLLGRVKDDDVFRTYFYASDYALLPLKKTIANVARWPSKVGDYLAAGLPVLTTPVGDFSNLLVVHNLGYCSKTDSSHEFAVAIVNAVGASSQKRKNQVNSARSYARNTLDWPVIASGLVGLYNSLQRQQ